MKLHHALGGKMVPPEERLKPLLISAPALAVAFFWSVAVTNLRSAACVDI